MIKLASFRSCPICGNNKVELLHHQKFTLPEKHPLPAQFDVVACCECGFAYADTEGNEKDYDRYYAEYSKYIDQKNSTGGGGNALDKARIQVMADAIVSKIKDKNAFIVDIGCANGGLLAILKDMGYTNLLGIDPSPICVRNTQELFGIPAEQGWLEGLPSSVKNVDLIVLSHVLEHVLQPLASIRKIRSRLADGGMVYAETPDACHYVDCLSSPFQDFNVEHINHFDTSSQENLFKAADFKARSIDTKFLENAPGLFYPAVFGFFQKETEGTQSHDWAKSPEFITNIKQYIKKSQAQLDIINEQLTEVISSPLIVWGTGQLTMKLLAETKLGTAEIAAFVDSNPCNHGKLLKGIKILSPESLKNLPPYPIIVGTLLHHKAIRTQIQDDLKLSNPIIELNKNISH